MKKLGFAILLASAFGAQAATNISSENFYQAETDKNIVTPSYAFSNKTDKADTTGAKENILSGSLLQVEYERGLNEMFSVGGTLGYTAANYEAGGSNSDSDVTGLNDLKLFFKGQQAWVEGSSFHYGTDLTLSTGNQEIDLDDKEISPNSGRTQLTPYVGYQWLFSDMVAGLRARFPLYTTDAQSTFTTGGTDIDFESTGGTTTTVGAFFEMPWSQGLLGFGFDYDSVSELTDTNKDNDSKEKTAKATYWTLSAYPNWNVNENTTVVSAIRYQNLISQDDVDSDSTFTIEVGGRFTF